jgi:ABC-type sugar transport system permease subunit
MSERRRSPRQVLARLRSQRILHAYIFIAPVIILFGIFRVAPSVQTLPYSFYKVELLKGRSTPIGLDNFCDRARSASRRTREVPPKSASRKPILGKGLDILFPVE